MLCPCRSESRISDQHPVKQTRKVFVVEIVMENQTQILMMFSVLLLPVMCGCSDSEADDSGEDHHHHLEHFVPHHKPANFATAVEEIEHRAQHLSDHAGHGHADEKDEFLELVDIVNWIPELAADSDLNEADWKQAKVAATALAASLARQETSKGILDLKSLSEVIATELQTLQSLTAAAGKPEPAIQHDHHHGHDDDHDHHDHDADADHDDHDH